jgi:hypothetical protein
MEKHGMYLNMIKHASHFFHLVNLNDVDGTGAWDCKNIMGICSLHFYNLDIPQRYHLVKIEKPHIFLQ